MQWVCISYGHLNHPIVDIKRWFLSSLNRNFERNSKSLTFCLPRQIRSRTANGIGQNRLEDLISCIQPIGGTVMATLRVAPTILYQLAFH